MAERHRRLERGLYADDGQLWVFLAQQVDGGGCGGVAGHHQGLGAQTHQVVGEGASSADDMGRITFAVGCVAAVGHIHKALAWQLSAQRL